MINKKIIERIFEISKVEEVISDFICLKKIGYKALSPFYNEKHPSLIVSPLKQIWKDFSSGKGGNVVNFLMEYEKFNFLESIKYLAKKYNIEIINSYKESLFIINNYAKFFFKKELNLNKNSLFKRQFNLNQLNKFDIGYAPYNKFTNSALKKGFKLKLLKKSGLINNNPNRIIFPIHSISGLILGFGVGGRSFSTPESEIYHKGNNLYGIYQAKKYILKYNFCYLTEGYTDVISMYQFGIKNVVASLGTSLTLNQIFLIKRFTKNLTIIYDSDESGINYCLRLIDILLEQDINLKIISLPFKEDPDSFFKKKNYNKIINYLKINTFNFINFKLNFFKKKKFLFIKDIINSLSKISDLIIRDIYLKYFCILLNINEYIILSEIEYLLLNKFKQKSFHFILNEYKKFNTLIVLEEKLLQISLLYGNVIITSNNYIPLKGNKKITIIEEFRFQMNIYNLVFYLEKNKYVFNVINKPKFVFNKIFYKDIIKLISLIDQYEFDFFNLDIKKISQYFIETLLRYKSYYISNIIKNKFSILNREKKFHQNFLLKTINLTNIKNNINKKLNILI
ncbi:DNA primase [Candidatus Karelsulcia muelleri CARI]|uniref:DNA primase n=1 Tax=Karelsulcia muelleri (strain CARI) TaxID=706194 RepID=E0TJA0_KARMC|nr:DNA primase [Candidatus Karelsulcia muelleri CARI]